MPQVLKDEIRDRIAGAALTRFSRDGFSRTRMSEIASAAGVSTGNIYRYFRNKDDLFDALIDDRFVARFLRLLRRRITALDGVDDIGDLAPEADFFLFSENLLRFCLAHRSQVVILLANAEGTRQAGFADRLRELLVELAIAHFQSTRGAVVVTGAIRFNLDRIYANFVETMAGILAGFENESEIREAIDAFSRYHMVGLKHLLG